MRLAFAAAAGAAIIAGSASASTLVDIQRLAANGSSVNNMIIGGSTYGATGGPFELLVTGSGGAFDGGRTVTTFCIELNETIGGSATGVEVFSGSEMIGEAQRNGGSAPDPGKITETELRQLSWLFDNHYAEASSSSDANVRRAFQILVWEIVYENQGDQEIATSIDLASGNFVKTSGNDASRGVANGWVNAANNDAAISINGYDILGGLTVLTRTNFQDQITLIPLPAPVLMGLAGLGAAIAGRRRMMRG